MLPFVVAVISNLCHGGIDGADQMLSFDSFHASNPAGTAEEAPAPAGSSGPLPRR